MTLAINIMGYPWHFDHNIQSILKRKLSKRRKRVKKGVRKENECERKSGVTLFSFIPFL